MSRSLMIACLLPLLFGSGCSNRDREEVEKKDDGVSTFRYQPPDMKKYTGKRETEPRQNNSAQSGKPTRSSSNGSAPTSRCE